MTGPQLETKGFFAALFDFGFTSFITLKFLRVIYIILVVVVCLTGLGLFLALASRGGASVVLAFIVAPIGTLLYLVFARVYMETIAMFFRIGENTSILVAAAHPTTPPATGYGPLGG